MVVVTGVISGVELKSEGNSVGTAITELTLSDLTQSPHQLEIPQQPVGKSMTPGYMVAVDLLNN